MKNKGVTVLGIVWRFVIAIPVMLVIMLWPAGSWYFYEAYIYTGVQMCFSGFLAIWLYKNNKRLLEERLKKEMPKECYEKIMAGPFFLSMVAIPVVAGFDFRFGWSEMCLYWQILGGGLFLVSAILMFLVMRENTFLALTTKVQDDHKVISTGPYSVVRHPMYSSVLMMMPGISLLLGSFCALIPSVIAVGLLLIRTYFEEATLKKELKGYEEYSKKVSSRVIPYVW